MLRRNQGLGQSLCRAPALQTRLVRTAAVAGKPIVSQREPLSMHTRWNSTAVAAAPVTESEVLAVQQGWADAIARISKVYKDEGDYVAAAAEAAGELYAYGHHDVLFKPTKAAEYPFRPTAEEAISYFVGGNAVEGGYKEDGGFAINGGKGFSKCVYDNHQIALKGDVALAMGEYYFTCATTNEESKVEYTFGYQRCDDGKVRIFLHHSSVPYKA